jgi:hypothetical protein
MMDEIIDWRIGKRGAEKEEDKVSDTEDDLEHFVRAWEKEFDRLNVNPEENSDFDSDNDINPIDSVNKDGSYFSTKK